MRRIGVTIDAPASSQESLTNTRSTFSHTEHLFLAVAMRMARSNEAKSRWSENIAISFQAARGAAEMTRLLIPTEWARARLLLDSKEHREMIRTARRGEIKGPPVPLVRGVAAQHLVITGFQGDKIMYMRCHTRKETFCQNAFGRCRPTSWAEAARPSVAQLHRARRT